MKVQEIERLAEEFRVSSSNLRLWSFWAVALLLFAFWLFAETLFNSNAQLDALATLVGFAALAFSLIVCSKVIRRKKISRLKEFEFIQAWSDKKQRILSELGEREGIVRQLGELQRFISIGEMRIEGATGLVVSKGESLPGVDFVLYERWIYSAQGVDGSLKNAKATFVDNSGKVAYVEGSVSFGAAQSFGISQNTNQARAHSPLAFNTTATNFSTVTQNFVKLQDTGSAVVHVTSDDVDGFITFSNPHFAAAFANDINSIGKSSRGWVSSIKVAKAELSKLKVEFENSMVMFDKEFNEWVETIQPLPEGFEDTLYYQVNSEFSNSSYLNPAFIPSIED
jgi:hypothetical protein